MKTIPQRKSPRLPEFDYSQKGAYFITFCTDKRLPTLGNVVNGQVVLNQLGEILRECWLRLPSHYPDITLDEFIIMPNHFHGVVFVGDPSDLQSGGPQTRPYKATSLTEVVGMLKSFATRRMKDTGLATDAAIWQRGFYDHVIRNDSSLKAIREYIINNPLSWEQDELNPLANNATNYERPQRVRAEVLKY